MRVNLINNTKINFYTKAVNQNPITAKNQVSFNGLGDFVTLQRNKAQAKKEAKEIKTRGLKILVESKEIKKQASEILSSSDMIVSKASKLDRKAYMILVEAESVLEVLNGDDGELSDYRVISQLNNGKIERVVEKYNKDNTTLSKKAIIGKDRIVLYDYKGKNKLNAYYLNPKTKKLDKVLLGAQFSAVGMRADEKYVFSRYGLASYSENYSTTYDKFELAQDRYLFGKYGLKTYMYGYENQFGSMIKAGLEYKFEDDFLYEYTQDLRSVDKVAQSSSKKYYYDINGLYRYEAGNEIINGQSEVSRETFEFSEKRRFSTASVNYKFYQDNSLSYDKLITYNFQTGKVKEFYEDLKITPKSKEQLWWNESNETYKAKYEF